MRILITGHAGFVGQHFWRALADDRHELNGFDIAVHELQDVRRMDMTPISASSTPHYDLVIHCAAVVGGRRTIDGSPLAVAQNLAIDQALFAWALRARPGRILYLSSSAVYPVSWQMGSLAGFRLPENAVDLSYMDCPDQTYGWAKLTGEMLAQHVAADGIPVHVVRPFSGYSADQSLDYPWPSFLARALRHDDPFDVWGDGLQVRDWIHIDDVIAGALAVVEQDVREPVNLCTGISTNFIELARMFTRAAGYSAHIETKQDEPTGVRYRVGDPTLMNTIYRPKITLEEAIAKAVRA